MDRRTGASGLIEEACATAGFAPHIASRLDQQPAIQAAVAAGIGVTLIPMLATRQLHPGVVLQRVQAAPVRHIAMHRLGGPVDAVTAAGMEALAAAAATRPG